MRTKYSVATKHGVFTRTSERTYTHLVIGRVDTTPTADAFNPPHSYWQATWCGSEALGQKACDAWATARHFTREDEQKIARGQRRTRASGRKVYEEVMEYRIADGRLINHCLTHSSAQQAAGLPTCADCGGLLATNGFCGCVDVAFGGR